jgi:hypothetical protein
MTGVKHILPERAFEHLYKHRQIFGPKGLGNLAGFSLGVGPPFAVRPDGAAEDF